MIVKKFIISIILSTNILLGSAAAAGFDSDCTTSGGAAWKNIKINKVFF